MNPISAVTLEGVSEVGYALRLPPELKAKLARWAKASQRSLNGQIVAVLLAAVVQAERKGEIPSEEPER